MKREFLQLCSNYKDQDLRSYYMSTKLDGQRCFWDGGISRGLTEVPFASVKGVATGLWSRYGKVIHAPDWFLDRLPAMPLDGELYIHGNRQECRSIVSRLIPDDRWNEISYKIFNSPPLKSIFADGYIDNLFYKQRFRGVVPWALDLTDRIPGFFTFGPVSYFNEVYDKLKTYDIWNSNLDLVDQVDADPGALDSFLDQGFEGLVFQHKYSFYQCCRSKVTLKMKPDFDSEGVVVGFEDGKGKYLGMMGSVVLDWKGIVFNISGFTDLERSWGYFKIGDMITFKYRSLTNSGVPVEARFFRKYK